MAGNAVLLKHASQTLLAGDRFQMAMDRAGMPKGLFQNLVLSHDQTARILGAGLGRLGARQSAGLYFCTKATAA